MKKSNVKKVTYFMLCLSFLFVLVTSFENSASTVISDTSIETNSTEFNDKPDVLYAGLLKRNSINAKEMEEISDVNQSDLAKEDFSNVFNYNNNSRRACRDKTNYNACKGRADRAKSACQKKAYSRSSLAACTTQYNIAMNICNRRFCE